MGYNIYNWDFLAECISKTVPDPSGKTMLELGNQVIKKNLREKLKTEEKIAKKVFEQMGFVHVSFDINGEDGALPINLAKPIEDEHFLNAFDVITNSGTSEHVGVKNSQYNCFKNMHQCAKIGCVFIHIVPEVGSWVNHCPNYYSEEFFIELSRLNTYEIHNISRIVIDEARVLVGACLIKKGDRPFTTEIEALLRNITIMPCSRKSSRKK